MGLVVVLFSFQLFKLDCFVSVASLVPGSSHISEQKGKNEVPPWMTRSQICSVRKAVPPEMGFGSSLKSQQSASSAFLLGWCWLFPRNLCVVSPFSRFLSIPLILLLFTPPPLLSLSFPANIYWESIMLLGQCVRHCGESKLKMPPRVLYKHYGTFGELWRPGTLIR